MGHICYQEQRLAKLEADMSGQKQDSLHLSKELSEIKSILKWIFATIALTSINLIGFLIWQLWVSK